MHHKLRTRDRQGARGQPPHPSQGRRCSMEHLSGEVVSRQAQGEMHMPWRMQCLRTSKGRPATDAAARVAKGNGKVAVELELYCTVSDG